MRDLRVGDKVVGDPRHWNFGSIVSGCRGKELSPHGVFEVTSTDYGQVIVGSINEYLWPEGTWKLAPILDKKLEDYL